MHGKNEALNIIFFSLSLKDRHNFICAIRLCLRPFFCSALIHFSVGFFLFCHRSPTATSSWSHYMYHIFNGCNIIIFLFFVVHTSISPLFLCCSSERSTRLLWTSTEYKPTCGWCAAGFFIYFAMLLSWKHITISLCWHNNALSPPVAALVAQQKFA